MKHYTLLLFWTLLSVSQLVFAHTDFGRSKNAPVQVKRAPQGLSGSQESNIKTRLARNSKDSWVSGTRAQALLELDTPELSVFSSSWTYYLNHKTSRNPSDVNRIARYWYSKRSEDDQTLVGPAQGSAGDPTSLLVAYLWGMLTDQGAPSGKYLGAIWRQIDYIRYVTPRLDDGTISHRAPWEPVQLWDDFLYMMPPSFALWGVYQGDTGLIDEAYNQCRLYRKNMRDSNTKLWRHVLRGNWQDNGFWGTGMGWVAAGMVRTAATLQNSDYAGQYSNQIQNLKNWAMEIIRATLPQMTSMDLLPNYYNDGDTFPDASSSAMIASSIYRLSQLGDSRADQYLTEANRIRQQVYRGISSRTGWNSPVVDPLSWHDEIHQSPEAIAFILIMEAACRDAGQC